MISKWYGLYFMANCDKLYKIELNWNELMGSVGDWLTDNDMPKIETCRVDGVRNEDYIGIMYMKRSKLKLE